MILAEPGDIHALVVLQRLHNLGSRNSFIWDTSRFPVVDRASQTINSTSRVSEIVSSSAGKFRLADLRAVWCRRPAAARVAPDVRDEATRSYCKQEAWDVLWGALTSLDVPLINKPASEYLAERKGLQLSVAAASGLRVPATLLSNDPTAVRDFYEECERRVVFKASTPPAEMTMPTQVLESEHLQHLDLLRSAPVIFQRLVPPGVDVRVTVVGQRIFAAEARTTCMDWRTDPNLKWRARSLSQPDAGAILELMRRLDLATGSLDFRVDEDGELVFFEVNPGGQFLFLEISDPELAISAELAALLLSAS